MKATETKDAVVLQPESTPKAAVIWLHGLGADGHDFVPIVPELELDDLAIRFTFPHAPVRAVTLNAGMRMRAWYDIPSLRDINNQDEAGVRESEQIVHGYIQRELDGGIPSGKIVLAGFSQGGAVVLHTGVRYPRPLAGVLALSTYLPIAHRIGEARLERRDTPILMCHGEHDPVLAIGMGEGSRDLLLERGYTVDWRQYPMQHQVCAEEIAHVADWLRARLGP